MHQRSLRRRHIHRHVCVRRRIRRNVFFVTEQKEHAPIVYPRTKS
ncbi:hypothetical protein [Ferrimonas gelatinilytica]